MNGIISGRCKGYLRLVDIARELLAHDLSLQGWERWLMQEIVHYDLCVQKHACVELLAPRTGNENWTRYLELHQIREN